MRTRVRHPREGGGRAGVPRRGISLMEAVLALAIVGVTAVAALGAVGADLRAAERARRALEAEALATHRGALLDLLTDAELRSLPDSVESGTFDAPLDQYKWRTTVASRETEPGVHDVVVRVEWPGGAYSVASAVYRRPLELSR